jgi:hypothetical protein
MSVSTTHLVEAVESQSTSSKALNVHNTSASNQRSIILEALKKSPKTTIELRHDYGIMQPAPRVLELKAQGYLITSLRVQCNIPDGIKHSSVANYVLVSKAGENE